MISSGTKVDSCAAIMAVSLPMTIDAQTVRADAVRAQVMAGVASVLESGRPLTFKEVASASGVAERTLYRYYSTREELLAGAFEWVNQRLGVPDEPPTDARGAAELARRAFRSFDSLAAVVRELLAAPEGLAVRMANRPVRQRAALALVRHEVPGVGRAEQRRLAAAVQVLTTASTWQALRDHWEMDGAQAGETAANAIHLLLEGARARRAAPERTTMQLISGINHVAVLTDDLDRFVAFYSDVFDLETVFSEETPAFRHAILRTGPRSWLHPAQVTDGEHGAGLPDMFRRGHLDHLALNADSPEAFDELRARLVDRQASDGAIEDLGAFHATWFQDPDGMRGELTVIVDPALRGIHAPRPAVVTASGQPIEH